MMSDIDFGELGLKLLPAPPRRERVAGDDVIRLSWQKGKNPQGGYWQIVIPLGVRRQLALQPPCFVQVLVGRQATLAIRQCDASEPQARRFPKSAYIYAPDLASLLELDPAKKYDLPCEIANGHVIARVPAEIPLRRKVAK